MVSGTPTAAGDFTFVIQVTDGGRSDSETYTLNVVEELKITQAKAPLSEVGQPFVLQLKATGGRPALVWSLADGTALPAGLTLDAATGLIGGKPTVAGSYPLKLTVTDQLGLTQNVDVTVAVAAKLAVVKKALPVVKIGKLYKGRLTAHGGAIHSSGGSSAGGRDSSPPESSSTRRPANSPASRAARPASIG